MAGLSDFLNSTPAAPDAEIVPTTDPPVIDRLTAQLEATKYRDLCAVMDPVLAADEVQPADALRQLIAAMYGEHSPEAAKVSQPPAAARGGAELAIATIRGQQATIKAQQRKLSTLQKELAEAFTALDNEAIAIARDAARTPERGLADVLEVAMSPDVPTATTLKALYTKHQGNTEAMGLLLGVIVSTLHKTGIADMYDTHALLQLHTDVLRELTATV